jgi:hypothetical protein
MQSQGNRQHGDDGRIIVLDEDFREQRCDLNDRKVTGNQIALAAGFRSSDNVIVLQQLKTGALEEIRGEELVDLSEAGFERFFVIEGDATYRFLLDGLKLEWPRSKIAAATLLKLAGKDASFEVVQELEGQPDRVLDDDDLVDLKGDGTERFRTKPAAKTVTVYYGEAEFVLPRGVYSTEQLIGIFKVEAGYVLDRMVGNKLVELKPGEKTRLKDGMRFTSHPPRGQSS